jgi:hypothetical protein
MENSPCHFTVEPAAVGEPSIRKCVVSRRRSRQKRLFSMAGSANLFWDAIFSPQAASAAKQWDLANDFRNWV